MVLYEFRLRWMVIVLLPTPGRVNYFSICFVAAAENKCLFLANQLLLKGILYDMCRRSYKNSQLQMKKVQITRFNMIIASH